MIAITRLSVASCSQSIVLPSNGSMANAMLGFFQGSLNSGDWAKTEDVDQTSTSPINISLVITMNIISAKGALCKSLGRSPRFDSKRDSQALKARNDSREILDCRFIPLLQSLI